MTVPLQPPVDPALLRLTEQRHEGESPRGALTQVDVTTLGFAHLAELEGLRVFDPAPKPLRQDAKDVASTVRKGKADRWALRDRARWFDELAARSDGHSLTGSARSAFEWGRHYLHHRRLGVHPERFANRLHQLVGYGFKPLPAIATLLLLTAAVSLFALGEGCADSVAEHGGDGAAVEQYCVHDNAGRRWWDWPQAWLSVLVAPAKLVRLTDTASPLPYFTAPVDSLVNVAITVTFLFTILALRNYPRFDRRN